jgi:hypothetical protein
MNSPIISLTKLKFKGTIYLLKKLSVDNFRVFSTVASAVANNTCNKYSNLPKISEHIFNHKSNLSAKEFGEFLAGLIEGNG